MGFWARPRLSLVLSIGGAAIDGVQDHRYNRMSVLLHSAGVARQLSRGYAGRHEGRRPRNVAFQDKRPIFRPTPRTSNGVLTAFLSALVFTGEQRVGQPAFNHIGRLKGRLVMIFCPAGIRNLLVRGQDGFLTDGPRTRTGCVGQALLCMPQVQGG